MAGKKKRLLWEEFGGPESVNHNHGIELDCISVHLEEYLGGQYTLQAKTYGYQKKLEMVLSQARFLEDKLSQVKAVALTI